MGKKLYKTDAASAAPFAFECSFETLLLLPETPLELNKAWDGLAGGFPGGAGPMRSGVGGPLPAGTNRGRQSGTSRNLGPERLSVQG